MNNNSQHKQRQRTCFAIIIDYGRTTDRGHSEAMSAFFPYTQQGLRKLHGTTAKDLLNSIRDGSWRTKPSEPQYVAAPVPSRGRASFADILDNDWELWRGGVQLAITKQTAVQHESPVSNDSLDIRLLCAHLGVTLLGPGRE